MPLSQSDIEAVVLEEIGRVRPAKLDEKAKKYGVSVPTMIKILSDNKDRIKNEREKRLTAKLNRYVDEARHGLFKLSRKGVSLLNKMLKSQDPTDRRFALDKVFEYGIGKPEREGQIVAVPGLMISRKTSEGQKAEIQGVARDKMANSDISTLPIPSSNKAGEVVYDASHTHTQAPGRADGQAGGVSIDESAGQPIHTDSAQVKPVGSGWRDIQRAMTRPVETGKVDA